MKHVLGTGVSGHLGFVLARELKQRGYEVRGSVRHKAKLTETPWLEALGIEIVEADVTDREAMEKALEGVDGLFQVAAVFNVAAKDPEREVIRPNVAGT